MLSVTEKLQIVEIQNRLSKLEHEISVLKAQQAPKPVEPKRKGRPPKNG